MSETPSSTPLDVQFPCLGELEADLVTPGIPGGVLASAINKTGQTLVQDPFVTGEALQQFLMDINAVLTRNAYENLQDSAELQRSCYKQLLSLLQCPDKLEGYGIKEGVLSFAPQVDTGDIFTPDKPGINGAYAENLAHNVREIVSTFYFAQMAQDDGAKRDCVITMLYWIDGQEDRAMQRNLMKAFFSRPSAAVYAAKVIHQETNGHSTEEQAKEAYTLASNILSLPFPKTNALIMSGIDVVQLQMKQAKTSPNTFQLSGEDTLIRSFNTVEQALLRSGI